ncbi:2-dehydropantoate 2-reductase [Variovorax sp. SG517]|uniref:2-dehydropantoate 2-reductase n=1 Tax=Variovorax sp. SG517 TaxID=2587117 RepID=UPI00181B4019|nr:2-dehydropantoate 2-reductase [Variovorax sp. SG517]NVM93165.1 2-dehydropantoate 2-reductase [Variovorax sp. SG517]
MASTITILGAGSIGAFVGGALLNAGADVRFIGRSAMGQRIKKHGLHVSDLHGWDVSIPAESVQFSDSIAGVPPSDLLIVAVKSADTDGVLPDIGRLAKPGSIVASFQNGVGNVQKLRDALPNQIVVGAMIPFNVVQLPDGRLHRATLGELMVESHEAWHPWLSLFSTARLPLTLRTDFVEVQWGKLLLNLNNPINALSGEPLRAQLSTRGYRRVLAALVEEALMVLDAASIKPAAVGGLPCEKIPGLLCLEDQQYLTAVPAISAMDPQARSSMWEDLEAGRLTEVDDLNGAVVRLAAQYGGTAETNKAICELIHVAERGGDRHMSPDALIRALNLS